RLRGNRNFATRDAYEEFIRSVVQRRNKDRQQRLSEELRLLKDLPRKDWRDPRELTVAVSPWSTVIILRSTYSVPSRLIGSKLRALVYSDHVELYFGVTQIQEMPRVRPGEAVINYRHVIGQLVRKPGAFQNYRYREELFPSVTFRRAFDKLLLADPARGHVEYLRILNLAAMNGESAVQRALHLLLDTEQTVSVE